MGAVNSSGTSFSQEQLDDIMNQVENYDGKTKTFVDIMECVKSLGCETALGEPFHMWKLACLYNNTSSRNNDLGPNSANIIADFTERQAAIKHMPPGEKRDQLMKYLQLGMYKEQDNI